ncbi:GIY-YIG nuclease family protein [Tenacibaculum finnmarkense genomovar ulcerans]|uniref:GIY-YIG nuclease family protein n=1 Tax=Tenacibaculum finnmarkense TaxID=2781243 RepID=UPI001E4C2FD8|nr:GIY-YIG nuclease family protein [Tenacibaculum finnmarkense]MCD8428626.1 GIY-YIG nuclease family protein [Tenacibaculum finnmarkense genomovar ulcerans]
MAKQHKFTPEDDDLLAALGVEVEVKKKAVFTALEERVIAGFEEIQKFVEEEKRLPLHGEENDIFERLYAVRIEKIKEKQEFIDLLKDIDYQNILSGGFIKTTEASDDLDDDELLSLLGVKAEENSITNLKHVKTRAEKRAVEEFANRTICEDFEKFKLLFEKVKKEIENGFRETIRFRKDAGFTKTIIKEKLFVIIRGQIAYIANKGEIFKAPNGEEDARLRVIYDNGTENDLLQRSLIRAMYKDETSRFLTTPGLGPLFSDELESDDLESGTIYVLRSNSKLPEIIKNREVYHKIGVTGNDVNKRIVNAKNDPTFLMAEVEVVATYKLANIKRHKLENLIQSFFKNAKLDIDIKDRFGKPVNPKEWFLVPIFIIDEVVEKIKDGTIGDYYYDVKSAGLKKY